MNKKGQLTIFIIIGIALLFSTALILYIRQSVTQYKPPVEITTEQVPTEIQPIQKYVTDCLQSTALDALRKAGMQGGYVDGSKIVVNDADPTSGEGISITPGSAVHVPYWHYMKSPNTCDDQCEFASLRPSLSRTGQGNSVEEQVDKYVEQKLSSCLANFIPFKAQGFDFEEGKIKALTTIARTDVFVQLSYDLSVKKEGRVEKLSKFTVQIPLNFGKLYDLATEISQKQIETSFLDHVAINLIDSYSSLDKNSLPPLADTDFGKGAPITWQKQDVKNKLEDIFMNYIPALQATGTSNFQGNYYNGNDPLAKGLYSFFVLPLNKTYRANAEFAYLSWWPIYLDVTPNSGGVIRPKSASGFDSIISALGITQYRFAYDVSYPVLITLADPTALDGQGFVFQFALESNLRNNLYMTSNTKLDSFSGRGRQTLVCDPQNFKSGEVTVDVRDSITKQPLPDSAVTFSFGADEACLIGETQFVSKAATTSLTGAAVVNNPVNNQHAILRSPMPVGIGSLIVSHEDYLSKTIPFGAVLDEQQNLTVELDPTVELDASLAEIPIIKKNCTITTHDCPSGDAAVTEKDCNWQLQPSQPGLAPTESAVVSFIRVPENDAQEEFVSVIEFKGNGPQKQKLRLVPGTYQIVANLFDNQRTIVPEDKVCYNDDWYDSWGFGKPASETIPAITFNTFPKGGLSIGSFKIDSQMLKGKKEVVITLFAAPSGYARIADGTTNIKHADLEQSGKMDDYSNQYLTLVQPQFK